MPVAIEHVVDDEWGQAGAEFARGQTRDAALLLQDALGASASAFPMLTIDTWARHGSPAWTLAASCTPEDLLVVGTHKTGYLHGRALGSMSIVVAAAAPCNVAVIPDCPLSGRRGVVVGIASGDAAIVATRAGAEEANRLNQDLSLIHACPSSSEATAGRVLLSDAARIATITEPNLTIRSRVSHRRPAEALLDASHTAALLVVGASRTRVERAGFIGSLTHDVLLNLNVPVLIARTASR
jgi:nucleotide-binding universal stress UspA family protein